MTNPKKELTEMYNQMVSGNTNIRNMTDEGLVEFGITIFHLLYTINRIIEETEIKTTIPMYLSLIDIKNVGNELKDYPEKLTGDRINYLRGLQYKFNQYHESILFYINNSLKFKT